MEKQRKTRTSPEQEKPPSGRRLHGAALVSVIGALFFTLLLEALDQTIVSTAMPRIASSPHGFDRYAWVITAYLLASTMMIPLVGKLSDQFGRKGFLILGTALFLLGSLLAGASQTMDQLILFRALLSEIPRPNTKLAHNLALAHSWCIGYADKMGISL